MGDDIPRDYDTEYTKPVGWEGGRLRIGHNRDPEKPKAVPRFVIQLEYFTPGGWTEVVRCDHDAEGSEETTHDVTQEGVHMDVYRGGEKVDTEELSGPVASRPGFTLAEEHLTEHAEEYIKRYKEWHLTDE